VNSCVLTPKIASVQSYFPEISTKCTRS